MTITRETIDAIIARMHDGDDADDRHEALIDLGGYCGQGTPADEAMADEIGPDYICALDDGTIVAWGADRADGGREVVYL